MPCLQSLISPMARYFTSTEKQEILEWNLTYQLSNLNQKTKIPGDHEHYHKQADGL